MSKLLERKVNRTDIKLFVYLFVAFLFLITIGISAVKGEVDFEFFADSETYMEFAAENLDLLTVYSISPNMVGPTAILYLLQQNYFLIFLFNGCILLFMYFKLANYYDLRKNKFFLFLLISPIMFSSIIAINKEIVSLLCISLFFIYFKNKKLQYFILAVLVSILVRWQMALFIIVLYFLLLNYERFFQNKKLYLLVFLALISLVYFLNLAQFEKFNSIAEAGQEMSEEGTGFFSLLLNIQNSNVFGYFITWLPKFLFLFVGLIARYHKVFDFTDIYNNFFTFWQCCANLYVLYVVLKMKIPVKNVFLFSALVYSMIFSLSPIFSPRYLFPVYILMVLAVCSHKNIKKQNK